MTPPRKQVSSAEIQPLKAPMVTKSLAFSLAEISQTQLHSRLRIKSHFSHQLAHYLEDNLRRQGRGFSGVSLQQAARSLVTQRQWHLARACLEVQILDLLFLSLRLLLLRHRKTMMMRMAMIGKREKNLHPSTQTLQKLTSRAPVPRISSQVLIPSSSR